MSKTPRANLFKYLKYDKLTDEYCNDTNSADGCVNCPVQTECEYVVKNRQPFALEIWYKMQWLPYNISRYITNYYTKHKKTHYRCAVCGRIEAPYFYDNEYIGTSIFHDYGWWKIKSCYNVRRYICHHCAEHGFSPSEAEGNPWDVPREYTWDEWQAVVKEHNEKIIKLIKEKDPEYYKRWFGDDE